MRVIGEGARLMVFGTGGRLLSLGRVVMKRVWGSLAAVEACERLGVVQ